MELPQGEYTFRIMGDLFPQIDSAVIDGLATGRFAVAGSHDGYSLDRQTSLGLLTDQIGVTADDMRDQLNLSQMNHQSTAWRNLQIGDSYTSISALIGTLQIELNDIAIAVDLAIKGLQRSDMSAADKVTAINNMVDVARAYVMHKVGMVTAEINKFTVDRLTSDGTEMSLSDLLSGNATSPVVPVSTVHETHPSSVVPSDESASTHPIESAPAGSAGPAESVEGGPVLAEPVSMPVRPEVISIGPNVSQVPNTSTPNAPSIGHSIQPTTTSPVGTPVSPSNATSLVRPDASTLATPLTPQAQLNQFSNQFSEGLVQGMQNQVTMPVSPVAAAAPMQLDTHEPAATSQTSASAPAYAAAAPAPIAPVEQHAPMVAAPAPAPAIAAAPAAPVGQLPAYGADIRPATPILASAAAPPVPSTPAVASSVASAPTSASSSTALGQPAVVRHAPIAAPPNGMPIAGEAAFAAATSAVAGEVNHQAIEQARLHRLVDSIARQEPGFRWAIGEREDGSTLLVTDVACGWIPPGVEVPVGVEVLEPERRRGDLIALLGDASLTAAYSPGQYISQPDTSEPINMSTRSLHANPIKDLGWELGQATNWRDGLPQLAHTLAKAAAAGTGILDAEVDMLQQHLAAVRDEVMSTYPDHNPSAAENFMLLAAINALIAGDNRAANYHFAWFQAVGTTTPPL